MASTADDLIAPPVAKLLVIDTQKVQQLLWGLALAKATAENMTVTWKTTTGTWAYNSIYALENAVWSVFGSEKVAAGSIRIDLPEKKALEAIAAAEYANRLSQFYEVCKTQPTSVWGWLTKQSQFRDQYKANIDALFTDISKINTKVAEVVGTFAAVWAGIKLVSEVALTLMGAAPAVTGSVVVGQFLVGVGYVVAVTTVADSNADAVALAGGTSSATNLPGALTGDPVVKDMEVRVFQWARLSRKNANVVNAGTRSASRLAAAQKAAKMSAWLEYLGSIGLKYGTPVLKGLNVLCIGASILQSGSDFLATMEALYPPPEKAKK